jgi:hypothetical protein
VNCQWQSSCSNEGTNKVYRALSHEESDSLAHGEGSSGPFLNIITKWFVMTVWILLSRRIQYHKSRLTLTLTSHTFKSR